MGEVFITRKGGGGKAAAPTIAVTNVGGTWIEFEITNNDAASSGATIFVLVNYDPNSETDFDLQASQNGFVFAVAEGATVTQLVTGLDPDTSHTVSASAAVIKKLPSSIVTTDSTDLDGTGVTAPTVGPITENTFTSITFNVRNDDTVVPQIIKANITESTTVPTVYPFESSTLAALATGSITVSNLNSGTVYYIHARAFDGEFSSSNVVFGPYTQSSPIVATGGTITNYSDAGVDYRVHRFNSNETFAVTSVPTGLTGFDTVDTLIVGGGGASGSYAGGGGAGEVVHIQGKDLSAGSYLITIGAGGTGTTSGSYSTTRNGQSTTVFGETAKPGGGAKSSDDTNNPTSPNATYTVVANGGGGSSRSAGYFGTLGTTVNTTGTTTRYGGHRGGQTSSGGGSANQDPNYPGGGGGGAGGNVTGNTGGTTSNNAAGIGGPGVPINILQNQFYFGGGGGGGVYYNNPTTTAGSGGIGGGGGAGNNSPGQGGGSAINSGQAGSTSNPFNGGNGGANTGGGGGAGRGETSGRGGNGGSGIVIIRYVVGGTV